MYVGSSTMIEGTKRYVIGKTFYVDDISYPGMLHCVFVRSPYPHAIIKNINVEKALKHEGVFAVITGREIEENTRPIVQEFPPPAKYKKCQQKWLATDRVRHVGEPVAAVLANDRYVAEDAAEKVEVEYELLKPVIDAEEALKSDSPLLYPEWGSNIWVEWNLRAGDTDEVFKKTPIIVKEKFRIPRQSGTPLEPGGTVASYDFTTDQLVLWMSKQDPYIQRYWIAEALGIPQSRLRVIAVDVGGGFGIKLNHYAEDIVIAYAAMKYKKPVKWVITRREHFLTVHQSRQMTVDIEMAATNDGKILGLRGKIIGNVGVAHKGQWPHSGPATCFLGACLINGPYDIRNISIDILAVTTNTTPEGAFRGFGLPETTFVRERLIDILARKIHKDPLEIRKKNLIKEFPYKSVTDQVYDSGDYILLLDKLAEVCEYEKWREQQKRRKTSHKSIGIGLALYAEETAPTIAGLAFAAHEMVGVELAEDGKVIIRTGSPNIGTFHANAVAQVVADELGIDLEDIRIICGDTNSTPFSLGPYGSRLAIVACNAALEASRKLKDKILNIAADILETHPRDLEIRKGIISVKGVKDKAILFKQIAERAYINVTQLPQNVEPGLITMACHHPPAITYRDLNFCAAMTSGGMAVIVEVDLENGQVGILKCVHVHDCGRVINPSIVEGQAIGGLVQGIGGALDEEIIFNKDGQLLTSSFVEYLIPTAVESPSIINYEMGIPTPSNPLGVKGVGESGIIPPPAAIANAIVDALRNIDIPIEINEYPVTPERIYKAVIKFLKKEKR